jgi:hypothetical protein
MNFFSVKNRPMRDVFRGWSGWKGWLSVWSSHFLCGLYHSGILAADHTKTKYNIKMLYAHIPARKYYVRMESQATK